MIKLNNQQERRFIMENVLFEEWAKKWLEEKKNYVKESTYCNYRTILINHLIPELGKYCVLSINSNEIQKIMLKWSNNGRLDGRGGLSNKSIKDMIVVLKMCLRDAQIDESQIKNRGGSLHPDKGKKDPNLFALSEQSYNLYINAILKDLKPESLGILMCLYTGIRIGELCALQWSDINMEERLISVTKTIQRIYLKSWESKGKTYINISKPKSLKSERIIPISDAVYKILQQFRMDDSVYVITGKEKFIEPRLYRKHYKNFIEQNSLEYIKFHGLRHTFATRCIRAGADYKTVSELLGHASVNLTLNLYVHPHLEEKRKCVNLL